MAIASEPHVNGTLDQAPRRIGAIPWRSLSGELFQLERWDVPHKGTRWVALLGGAYLAPDRSTVAEWALAQDFLRAEDLKNWITSGIAWTNPAQRSPQPTRPAPPDPGPLTLLFKAGGRTFELRQCFATATEGESWYVFVGGRILTVSEIGPEPTEGEMDAWDLAELPFPAAKFPSAHEAQQAVEDMLATERQGRLVDKLRQAITQVEQGQLVATLGKGEPRDPSWTVTFRLNQPKAVAGGGGA